MFWQLIALILSKPFIADWLIEHAQRTPYNHIVDRAGTLYMQRWWLIKPGFLPFSIRVHHIVRPDADRHLHDHPFNYRTIILRGGYVEEDVFGEFDIRVSGDTVKATANTFHRISHVDHKDGAWTLFIMGRRRNQWGFMVDGHKVHWTEYLS